MSHRKRIPRKTKSLQEVKEVVADNLSGLSWDDASKSMRDPANKGFCLRRKAWPAAEFIFCRLPRKKSINDSTPDKEFFEPISKEFLSSRGVKRLHICGHINKWTKDNTLIVGFHIVGEDRQSCDWEIHSSPESIKL